MQRSVSFIALAAAVCFAGCSKEPESKPAMTPASGTQPPNQRGWTEGSEKDDPITGMPEPGSGTMVEQQPMDQPSGSTEEYMEEPMGQSPSGSTGKESAAMLSQTRCAREVLCGQVGSDKKYPSIEVCQATLLADSNKELSKCPSGMNRQKVQECAKAIESKGCEMPGDHLTEYEECQTISLCM